MTAAKENTSIRRREPARSADGRSALAAAMSERELENSVRTILAGLSLRWYHTFDSRRSSSGFPDLTIAGSRVLFRELKREGKNPTPAQQVWLDTLTAAGEDADVWRPSCLLSGRIARELTAISRLGRAA